MPGMRKIFVLLSVVFAQLAIAAPVAAATVDRSLAACSFGGGQTTVPAGSTVAVTLGLTELTRGSLNSLLQAQTVTATVNGSPIANAGRLWGPVVPYEGYGYATFWRYTDGTLANAGDQVSFTFEIILARPWRSSVGTFVNRGDSLIGQLSCTVTAV